MTYPTLAEVRCAIVAGDRDRLMRWCRFLPGTVTQEEADVMREIVNAIRGVITEERCETTHGGRRCIHPLGHGQSHEWEKP